MDMKAALIAHLKAEVASGRLGPAELAKTIDELHQIRRRIVKPRDASRDDEPITVGTAR